jgi:hypothetical protein
MQQSQITEMLDRWCYEELARFDGQMGLADEASWLRRRADKLRAVDN